MKLPYLKVPKDSDFFDQRYTRSHVDPHEPDWIFIEAAVEEDEEGNSLWPIHSLTSISDLIDAFNDPEFPKDATIVWEEQ